MCSSAVHSLSSLWGSSVLIIKWSLMQNTGEVRTLATLKLKHSKWKLLTAQSEYVWCSQHWYFSVHASLNPDMEWKLLAWDCCVIRGAGLKELQNLKRKDAVSLAASPACAGLCAGSNTTNTSQLSGQQRLGSVGFGYWCCSMRLPCCWQPGSWA